MTQMLALPGGREHAAIVLRSGTRFDGHLSGPPNATLAVLDQGHGRLVEIDVEEIAAVEWISRLHAAWCGCIECTRRLSTD